MKRSTLLVALSCLSMCGMALAGEMGASADMLKKMDTNKDGKVSMAENEAYAKMMFGMMDSNRDGSVTMAEMDAGHAKMMKDHKMMKGDAMMKDGMKDGMKK